MDKSILVRRKAQKLVRDGQIQQAISELEKVLGEAEADPYDHVYLGDLQIRLQRKHEAIAAWRDAVRSYEAVGLYRNAIAICKKILRVDPRLLDVHRALGDLYLREGIGGEAAPHLLTFLESFQGGEEPDEEFLQLLQRTAAIPGLQGETALRLSDLCIRFGREDRAAVLLDRMADEAKASGSTDFSNSLREKARRAQAAWLVRQSAEGSGRGAGSEAEEFPREVTKATIPLDAGLLDEDHLESSADEDEPADAAPPEIQGEIADETPGPDQDPQSTEPFGEPEPAVESIEGEPSSDSDHGYREDDPPGESPARDEPTAVEETEEPSPEPLTDLPPVAGPGLAVQAAGSGASGGVAPEWLTHDRVERSTHPEPSDDAGGDSVDWTSETPGGAEPDPVGADLPPDDESDRTPIDDAQPVVAGDDGRGAEPAGSSSEGISGDAASTSGPDGAVEGDGEIGWRVPEDTEELMEAIDMAMLAERWTAARRLGEAALRERPLDREILRRLIEIGRQIDDTKAVISYLIRLGDVWIESGDMEQALQVFFEVLRLDPEEATARRRITRFREMRVPGADELPSETRKSVLELIRPGGAKICVQSHADIANDGWVDLGALLEEFKQGIGRQIDGTDFQSHYDLAVSHQSMGLYEEAVEELDQVLAHGGTPVAMECRARELKGSCLFNLQKYVEAGHEFRGALETGVGGSDRRASILYQLGRSLEEAGAWREAAESYERIAQEGGSFGDAQERSRICRREASRRAESGPTGSGEQSEAA